MSLKADLQALACPSKYHDDEYLLMPTEDVRPDDYAPGRTISEECTRPTKVQSRNGWSFPILIMTSDNGNIIAILHEAPTKHISIHRDLLWCEAFPHTPAKTIHMDELYQRSF